MIQITADEMRQSYMLALRNMPHQTPRDMARAFAREAGVSEADFFGITRVRAAARARQDCWRMLKERTSMSPSAIGRLFDRHYSTVLYGIQASERRDQQ